MLPGADGIALMGSVPELADLPVVFISGYDRDETIAGALKAGAADYLVKPFSPTELTTRVGAALRRVSRPEPFALGELAIHYEDRRVTVAGPKSVAELPCSLFRGDDLLISASYSGVWSASAAW